jgi:hypothetical protein
MVGVVGSSPIAPTSAACRRVAQLVRAALTWCVGSSLAPTSCEPPASPGLAVFFFRRARSVSRNHSGRRDLRPRPSGRVGRVARQPTRQRGSQSSDPSYRSPLTREAAVMPQITLPDGSIRSFDAPVTVHDIAADIGPGLAKATLAGRVDGQLVDASISSSTTHRSPSSPTVTRTRWSCCATTRRTSWPRRCRNSIPAPRSPSARPSRTASTTTSPAMSPSRRKTWHGHRAAYAGDRQARSAHRARGLGSRRGQARPSASWARTTRSRSSRTSSPRARRSRSIARATGSTSAAARTCPAPASWARASS